MATHKRKERAMKKTILFIAVGIIVFCIVPIVTSQAMLREVESQSTIVSTPTDTIVPVLITELDSPALKDNVFAHDIQQQKETTIARKGSRPGRNPYVKRRGYGDSTMGDNESAGHDEEYGDDSAVEYNEGLEDSSGYNKDL